MRHRAHPTPVPHRPAPDPPAEHPRSTPTSPRRSANAGLRDVDGTGEEHITRALTPDRVKPGLNFVSRGIAMGRERCLGGAVFIPGNKAFALATLRHEMEHATTTRWRSTGCRSRTPPRARGRRPQSSLSVWRS